MNSKDFERICIHRMEAEEAAGRATMSRYGVQGAFRKGQPSSDLALLAGLIGNTYSTLRALEMAFEAGRASVDAWQPITSNPDFEGIVFGGRQFVFDCKLCNQASFPLDKDSKSQSKQHRHMRTRARFGAVCFYLIHFPPRELKTKTDPAATWAFPVNDGHFWQAFDRNEVKRITRADCEQYAELVNWDCGDRGRTPRPDILSAVERLAASTSPSTIGN